MFAYACVAALALVSIARLAEVVVAVALVQVNRAEAVERPQDGSLEGASRRFRVQVYNTFRLDREEFDRRRAAWEQAQARWREAGSRPDDQHALVLWLEQATYQSRPEVRGSLPEAPVFGAVRLRDRLDARTTERPPPRAGKQPMRSLPIVGVNPLPPGRETPRRAAPMPPTAPWRSASPPPTRTSPDVNATRAKPLTAGAPAAMSDIGSPARRTGPAKPPATQASDVPAIAPDKSAVAIDVNQEPAAKNPSAIRIKLNATNPLEVDEASGPYSAPAIAAPQPRGVDLRPQTVDIAPPRRTALAKPATAAADQYVPDRFPAPAPTTDSRPLNTAKFNLGELLARASGYSVGLRTVDSALHEEEDLSPAHLATLLAEVEILLNRRRDLLLYEQLLSAEDRKRLLRSLPFPWATVAGLGSRIARAREGLAAQAELDAAERGRQLKRLEELSIRLAKVHEE